MTTTDPKKSFWSDAAKGGLIVGLTIFVLSLLDALLELQAASWIMTVLQVIVIAVFIYLTTRAHAAKYGDLGFTYGQSMSFILGMMLFCGIIVGLGSYVLNNFIAPEYFDAAFEAALANNPAFDPDMPGAEEAIAMGRKWGRSAIALIFGGIFSMIIYGGLLGLIVSAFTKRKPNMFGNSNNVGTI